MVYNGVGLHSSFESGRCSGSISVSPNQITFSYEGNDIKFPMHKIEITSGGAGGRLIYFKHPDFPDWCFYSGDAEILKDPFLARENTASEAISKAKFSNKLVGSSLITLVLLVLLFLGGVILLRKEIVFKIAKTLPVEWEQKAGSSIFESIKLQKTLIEDSVLNEQVNILGAHLTKVVEDTAFHFKFFIVEDTTLNAFALPGGNVVIHSGLILESDSVEELMGVLGHEIAHVTERHHARGLITQMGLSFILSSFFTTDSNLADLIINTGGTLQSLKYGREFESEADDKGWEYLTKANINPRGMISFFKKLEKESSIPEVLSFISTHPATGERIEELQKKLKKADRKNYPSIPFDFKNFKEKLKEKIKEGRQKSEVK